MKRVAVIGGGPKAAALCAKAHCLRLAGSKINLHVFEETEWGAAWSGRQGYTDGQQRLCTPPERDVGFPYERGLLTADGVQELANRFSWNSFLVAGGGTAHSHRNWVDRGRKPPPHNVYAEYIKWVIEGSSAMKTIGSVKSINHQNGKWLLEVANKRTKRTKIFENFDGIVITGPGPASKGFIRPDDSRITNGVQFWNNPDSFLSQADDREDPIVIAGSGGTSAAIAAWIARRNRPGRPIMIIGNQAALFTRTESFFENALFSDEDAWTALDPNLRISVSERLNRGIVWSSVSEVLAGSSDVSFRPGRVSKVEILPSFGGAPEELIVEVNNAKGSNTDPASLVIDAAGFNPWWFVDLLPEKLKRATEKRGTIELADQRRNLVASMESDLSINLGPDGLHAPMLSLAQGPGFASLMVLGSMSERILQPYVKG